MRTLNDFFKNISFVLVVLLMVSCVDSGLMKDCKVKKSVPNKTLSIAIDSTFNAVFPEVLNPYQLQIVNDTILVVQEPISAENNKHFKAYSINTFDFLGELVSNGRGSNEIINPYLIKCFSASKCLNLNVASEGEVFSVDVLESLKSNNMNVVSKLTIPSGAIDCLPLPNSNKFILRIDKKRPAFSTLNSEDVIINTFNYSDELNDERFMPYLSNILVSNIASGKVAQFMLFLPQMNLYDTKQGLLNSFAVNKAYKNWKLLINKMIGRETRQYYIAATPTQDYIISVYKNVTLEDLCKNKQGSFLHIFDWNGNFLYEIKLKEDISKITFDEKNKDLYCIEKTEGRIIRYNLMNLL